MTAADCSAQRSLMTTVAGILGTVASFTIAAMFFYAGADSPSVRAVRTRWGGWFSGAFLRALATLLTGAFVNAFASLGVPSSAATIVFFSAVCVSLAKLGRILLIVAALLVGQQADEQELPSLERRTT